MVFHIFSNTIDFILGFVNFYLRISAGYGVNFSTLLLFFENWSFSDTDCELGKSNYTLFSDEKT
jgi:hypothetical protein